ncbi:hypothetical protein GF360_02380 [candidate division WWE3 bacterium]|nr:hypothetical protein [candidate division WWE3 bacterium]
MRSTFFKIPKYWVELRSYLQKDFGGHKRLFAFPYTTYGTAYNWLEGLSSTTDFGRLYLDMSNVSATPFSLKYSDFIINSIYSPSEATYSANFLGFLNIFYVIQENDVDWRYASSRTLDPQKMNQIISSMDLELIETFGQFTPNYLEQIPNEEPDDSLRNEMYVKLLGEPGLELYKIPDKYYLPKFYVPNQYNHVSGNFDDLLKLYSAENTVREPVYYFSSEGYPQTDFSARPQPSRTFVIGYLDEPRIDFGKLFWHEGWGLPSVSVNPKDSKYRLVLLKEGVEIFKERDYLQEADLHVWFASKRVAEIQEFELKGAALERAVDNLEGHLNRAMFLLEENPVLEFDAEAYETYWGMVAKVLMYSQNNIAALKDYPAVESSAIEALIERCHAFYTWIESRNDYSCEDTSVPCYVFDVPVGGEYEFSGGDARIFLESGEYSRNVPSDFPLVKAVESLPLEVLSPTVEIPNWDADKDYRVSFDYKILNSSVEVGVLEEQWDYGVIGDEIGKVDWEKVRQGDFPVRRERTQEHVLNSSQICFREGAVCYSNFEMIVNPSRNSVAGSIYFKLPLEQDFTKKIEIKNIKIEEYTEPFVYLKALEVLSPKEQTPQIEFERVNPTKYKVQVSGVTSPFDLVFIESYHKGWKLYAPQSSRSIALRDRFFALFANIGRGLVDVFELNLVADSGIFLDSKTFETWGKEAVPFENHFIANGFANSWRVTPEMVEDGEGTFIVEFWYQRLFYVGIFISGLTFILVCTYLVIVFLKNAYTQVVKR